MLGFVSIHYFVDRHYDSNEIHNYEENGDSFESIRVEAHRIFPNHRLVSMILTTGNDPVQDVTDEDGLVSDFCRQLNGSSGQRYGDALIDVHMSTIGINEE